MQRFMTEYDEARARFLREIEKIAAQDPAFDRGSFQVPSKIDQNLYCDDAYFPPTNEPENLLIMTSGVHGMEAATGSAIQAEFLRDIFPKLDRRKTGLYILHCFNPYGFKYGRRNTENNVNLNRNFGIDEAHFQTPNEGYKRLARWVEGSGKPIRRPVLPLAIAYRFMARAMILGRFNSSRLNQAMAQGQFEFPRGLEYGGSKREPQVEYFVSRIQKHMSRFKKVILFDLHTGLGERARLHLIPGDDPRCIDRDLFNQLFHAKEEIDLYVETGGNAPGFYKTVGDLNSLVAKLAPEPQRVLALTFEFGTLGNHKRAKVETLERVLAENRGHHNGFASASDEAWAKIQFRELFEPSEKAWRTTVLDTARETIKRAVSRL